MTVTPAPTMTPPEDRPEPDLSGHRVGDYQILRRLGRGGMAEVYLAEQLSLQRQVALKVLRKSLAGDAAYIRRFQHEAQAAAKLVHANIVQIYEVGCVDGTYYISQEYVPGQNLKQLLARLGHGVDAVQAVNIIRQVAAGLHKAAEQKIIHRDVKPENIMITPAGEVKVADFGLARVARDGEALNLTQVGITMGTPLYMSPEQVEGRAVDPRSDIYSFGVTAYHMLAGHPPFDGPTALNVAVQHLKTEPKRLEVLCPNLPDGLCRIVHKMLAKKPEERYQRPIDLLKDLKSLKIEGLDNDWTADLPGFNSADLALSTAGRLEATQQLDRLLRSSLAMQPQHWSRAGRFAAVAVLALAGVIAGGIVAVVTKPPPVLPTTPRSGELNVKRMPTVREQYELARLATHDREEHLLAVERYFPADKSAENRRYTRLSRRGRANLCVAERRLPEALKLYEQLANVEDAETDLQLSGIAGEAVVYHRFMQNEQDRQILEWLDQQVIERLIRLRNETNLDARISVFLAKEVRQLIEEYSQREDN
ncbi:MAG TPA: serine/threonine-protein kinase [Pirellulaceae bacterium]